MRVLQLFLSLILTATCFGQYLKPIRGMPFVNRTHRLGRGLVGFWFFNEGSGNKVFDLSGNNRTGTFGAGAASPSWVSGEFGSALSFDGGDYIDIIGSASGVLDITGPISVVTSFFTAGSTGATQEIVSKNKTAYELLILNAGLELVFLTGNDGVANRASGGNLNVNQRYQVIGVYDGVNTKIYVDGIWIVDATTPLAPTSTVDNLHIGARPTAVSRFLNGNIDYVYIYNRALSASEIAELYREPFGMMKQPNPLLYAGVVGAPPGVVVTPYYYRGILLFPLLPFGGILAAYSICFLRRDKKCAA